MRMKINAVINGEIVPVQVVKRGETVYVRRCAKTMFQPTEKQLAVRRNVALTSIEQFDVAKAFKENLTREEINKAVKEAFANWQKSKPRKPLIEEELEEEYGSQVSEVKESYKNLKTYNYP